MNIRLRTIFITLNELGFNLCKISVEVTLFFFFFTDRYAFCNILAVFISFRSGNTIQKITGLFVRKLYGYQQSGKNTLKYPPNGIFETRF